ncbi:hypothetical protein B0H13DRAFT_2482757 [Mycena leptocephala]|nr:hypothetical protein B0H13DRAFT_2482757 [Mycena leptocephala]
MAWSGVVQHVNLALVMDVAAFPPNARVSAVVLMLSCWCWYPCSFPGALVLPSFCGLHVLSSTYSYALCVPFPSFLSIMAVVSSAFCFASAKADFPSSSHAFDLASRPPASAYQAHEHSDSDSAYQAEEAWHAGWPRPTQDLAATLWVAWVFKGEGAFRFFSFGVFVFFFDGVVSLVFVFPILLEGGGECASFCDSLCDGILRTRCMRLDLDLDIPGGVSSCQSRRSGYACLHKTHPTRAARLESRVYGLTGLDWIALDRTPLFLFPSPLLLPSLRPYRMLTSFAHSSETTLKIGNGCALRSGARLLSGASMEDSSMLCEHTLLTSGEVADGGRVYSGWPAKQIDDNWESYKDDEPPSDMTTTSCGHIFCKSMEAEVAWLHASAIPTRISSVNQSIRIVGRGIFSMHSSLEVLYYRFLGANVRIDKGAKLTARCWT